MEMSIETRNQFIENNMGIIGAIIDKPQKRSLISYKKLAECKGYERDDLINSGVLGMIKAIKRFDETRGVPLASFVKIDILCKISEFIAKPRKHDRIENKISMSTPTTNNHGNYCTIGDMIANKPTEETFGKNIDSEYMRTLVNSDVLSDVERICIKMKFYQNAKLREINPVIQKHLDNSKAKAFYFINTGLAKLKKVLNETR